ncbi:ribosome biogenesis Nop16 [Cryptosporidium sp. chipmunk genotype I]|uniref:ribosome biogenesis Nop16 n=1 Tax=Cryptosporidium sp. chipmunk genotype I TaxID=1280935 RepID=UPI00351A0DC1|nr:ribosome biogenesis Nop16 [Cryptosporidium sp. chipmunk genotype I]
MAIKLSRRRTLKKVSRRTKSNKHKYVDLEKQIRDKNLRSVWDNKKTINQNFQSLDPEVILSTLPPVFEDNSIPEKLGEREEIIMKRLYKKYKENTDLMAKDIKLNPYQWNSNQCNKKLKIFMRMSGIASN